MERLTIELINYTITKALSERDDFFMMVEMYLVSNNDDTVTYRMYNTDAKENIGNMTVNKENKKYALDYADEMTTHFETATYRFIVGAIERGIYPEYAYDGWG